jgi:hypothetical protein
MATGTIVATYTVATAGGKDAVVTGVTIDGTAVGSATDIEKTRAWVCTKGVLEFMVKSGIFSKGVNPDTLTA